MHYTRDRAVPKNESYESAGHDRGVPEVIKYICSDWPSEENGSRSHLSKAVIGLLWDSPFPYVNLLYMYVLAAQSWKFVPESGPWKYHFYNRTDIFSFTTMSPPSRSTPGLTLRRSRRLSKSKPSSSLSPSSTGTGLCSVFTVIHVHII